MNSTETAAAEAVLEELLADTATDPEIVLLPHSKAIAAVALRLARALRPKTHDGRRVSARHPTPCDSCKAFADWDRVLAEIASGSNE